jgi:hypothetical protein
MNGSEVWQMNGSEVIFANWLIGFVFRNASKLFWQSNTVRKVVYECSG